MVTLYNENIKKEEQQMSKNNLIQETKNKSNVLETIEKTNESPEKLNRSKTHGKRSKKKRKH